MCCRSHSTGSTSKTSTHTAPLRSRAGNFSKLPHGRKFFDFPHEEFFREAAAGGDPALLDLIDPPALVETLCAVCAADPVESDEAAAAPQGGMPLRCIGVQPRTVPPDGGGGYTTWHRDMQDNQSVAVAHPTERVVKAIVYIHDCSAEGGANGAVVGTHRLPYSIGEVYGKQFHDGNEETRGAKSLPTTLVPNHAAFAALAGWAAIFDIAAWHTALPNNTAATERQNVILSYIRDPRFSSARGCGLSAEVADQIEAHGALSPRRRLLMKNMSTRTLCIQNMPRPRLFPRPRPRRAMAPPSICSSDEGFRTYRGRLCVRQVLPAGGLQTQECCVRGSS